MKNILWLIMAVCLLLPNRAESRDVEHVENRYEDENRWERGPSFGQDDPTDIVLRAFTEILNRRPTRDELREYHCLITRHDWSERQVRKELRRWSYTEGR